MSKKSRRYTTREPYKPELDQEEPKREPYKTKVAYLLDPKETADLVAASSAPYEDVPDVPKAGAYETYSQEEVVALLDGKPIKRKKKKKSSETTSSL